MKWIRWLAGGVDAQKARAPRRHDSEWTTRQPRCESPPTAARHWSRSTPWSRSDLGLTADELCTIYRTQFPVLYGYDRNTYLYDANGRLVPDAVLRVWRTKGDRITEEERTATNPSGNTYVYELPFVTLDREADMRQAYAHFEKARLSGSGSHDRDCCRPSQAQTASARGCWTTWARRSRWPTRTRARALDDFLQDPTTGIFKGPYVRLRLPFRPAADGWREHLELVRPGFTPYGHQAAAFARLSSATSARKPRPAADAGHHRHRLGQDRGVPLPDPRPRAARQARRRHRDEGADPLPDERAGQRPGPAARRPDHRRRRTGRRHAPPSTPAQPGRERTRVTADGLITDRASSADSAPDILLTNYKMLDQLLLRARGRQDLGGRARQPAVPGARRVPHLRRRAGHRRVDAAAPPGSRAEEPLADRRPAIDRRRTGRARWARSPRSRPRPRSATAATRRRCSTSPRPSSARSSPTTR